MKNFELTPVQRVNGIWVKRDDLFECFELRGGKARTCSVLASTAKKGLVTASARASPQSKIVATFASKLGIPCRIHTAWGGVTDELATAESLGAEILQHRPGYNSVIRRRAKDDAETRGWSEIPFGMESSAAIETTMRQVQNIPKSSGRIVVPVGSGMTLAGVLHGLAYYGLSSPVLGVVVGANPIKRLEYWAPQGWRDNVVLVSAKAPYKKRIVDTKIGEIELDPVYEAKCLPFLEENDCLWIVGYR